MEKYQVRGEVDGLTAANCNGKDVLIWRTVPSRPQIFASTLERYQGDSPMFAMKIIEWVKQEDTFFVVFERGQPMSQVVAVMEPAELIDVLLQIAVVFRKKGELTSPTYLRDGQLKICWLRQKSSDCWLEAPERNRNRICVITEEEKVWNLGAFIAVLLISEVSDTAGLYELLLGKLLKAVQQEARKHLPISDIFCLTKNMLKVSPFERVNMKMVEHSLHLIKAKLEKHNLGLKSLMLQSNCTPSISRIYQKNRSEARSFVSSLLPLSQSKVYNSGKSFKKQGYSSFHVKTNSANTKKFSAGLLSYASSQIKPVAVQTLSTSKHSSVYSMFSRTPKRDNYTDPTYMFRRLKEYEDSRFKRQIEHLEKLKLTRKAEEIPKPLLRPSSRRTHKNTSKRVSSPRMVENVPPRELAEQLPAIIQSSSNRRSRKVLPIDDPKPKCPIKISEEQNSHRVLSRRTPQTDSVAHQNRGDKQNSKAIGKASPIDNEDDIEVTYMSQPTPQFEPQAQIKQIIQEQSKGGGSTKKTSVFLELQEIIEPPKLDVKQLKQSEIEPKELLKLYNILGLTVKHANSRMKPETQKWSLPCFLIYKSYHYLRTSFTATLETSFQPRLLETLQKENTSIGVGLTTMYNSLKGLTNFSEEHCQLINPHPFPEFFQEKVVPLLHNHFVSHINITKKTKLSLSQNHRLKDYIRYSFLLGFSLIVIDHQEIFRAGPNLQAICAALSQRLDDTPENELEVGSFLQEVEFRIERIMKRY